MPGYQSSGTEALQELDQTKLNEDKAKEELEQFSKSKKSEMERMVEAFADCG